MTAGVLNRPAVSFFGERFFGPRKPKILTEQEERAKAEWDRLVQRPAHEYLRELATDCGATFDVESFRGKACSFWIRKYEEIGATPCLAVVELICRTGNVANVHIAAGPSGKPSVVYLYDKGCGSIEALPRSRFGDPKTEAVHNFQFL